MINNPIIFYLASIILCGFTICTLFLKNIIYALLSAIMVFFAAAIIFYILSAEYNAIIQAAIYGLAVPIIIGISIMFTAQSKNESAKNITLSYWMIFFLLVFILAFCYLLMISMTLNPETFHFMKNIQINTLETLKIFAKSIYTNYVWAFELVSLLLTIVIAGISLFKKKGV